MNFRRTMIGEVVIECLGVFFLQKHDLSSEEKLRIQLDSNLHQTYKNESFPLQINFLLTLQLQMIAFGEEVLIQVMRDFLWVIDDAQRSGIDLFDEEEFASLQFFPLDFHSKEFLLQIGERRSFRSLFDLHRSPVVEDRRKHFEHQLKVFWKKKRINGRGRGLDWRCSSFVCFAEWISFSAENKQRWWDSRMGVPSWWRWTLSTKISEAFSMSRIWPASSNSPGISKVTGPSFIGVSRGKEINGRNQKRQQTFTCRDWHSSLLIVLLSVVLYNRREYK